MTTVGLVVAGSAAVGCVLWAIGLLAAAWVLPRIPALPAGAGAPRSGAWPSVSVIVAARDEVETLGDAAATWAALEYPGALQIVLVDDRSEDGTGQLVDTLASQQQRVDAAHVASLPAGWLGKVHALREGLRVSRGEWVLLTDADVHLSRDTLRRAVSHAEALKVDHLALVPDVRSRSPWARGVMLAFLSVFVVRFRCDAAADPARRQAAGVGAFNLVRHEALVRSGALEALRMEIADDVGLSKVLVRGGWSSSIALAVEDVVVDWYPDVSSMVRGLEKNLFAAAAGFRVWLGALGSVLVVGSWLAPWVALIQPWFPVVRWAPLAVLAAIVVHAWRLGPVLQVSRWQLCRSHLVSAPVLAWSLARSTFNAARTGHVEWRGTRYPLSELRARRVLDL